MKKILLIDEDKYFHHIFNVIFRKKYLIDSATSSDKAYEFISNFKYDLIMVDIFLDNSDVGKTLISEIRKLQTFEKIPIICCTAHSSYIRKREVEQAGADYYLAKPVDSAKLIKVVDLFLSYGRDKEVLKKLELSFDFREMIIG